MDTPSIGLMSLPELAEPLRASGFNIIGGTAEFRQDGAAISTALKEGAAFPILAADQKIPGMQPWLTGRAKLTHLVLLRTQPSGGLAVEGTAEVALPATMAVVLEAAGFGQVGGVFEQMLVTPDGRVVHAGSATAAPAPVEPVAPAPEPQVQAVAPEPIPMPAAPVEPVPAMPPAQVVPVAMPAPVPATQAEAPAAYAEPVPLQTETIHTQPAYEPAPIVVDESGVAFPVAYDAAPVEAAPTSAPAEAPPVAHEVIDAVVVEPAAVETAPPAAVEDDDTDDDDWGTPPVPFVQQAAPQEFADWSELPAEQGVDDTAAPAHVPAADTPVPAWGAPPVPAPLPVPQPAPQTVPAAAQVANGYDVPTAWGTPAPLPQAAPEAAPVEQPHPPRPLYAVPDVAEPEPWGSQPAASPMADPAIQGGPGAPVSWPDPNAATQAPAPQPYIPPVAPAYVPPVEQPHPAYPVQPPVYAQPVEPVQPQYPAQQPPIAPTPQPVYAQPVEQTQQPHPAYPVQPPVYAQPVEPVQPQYPVQPPAAPTYPTGPEGAPYNPAPYAEPVQPYQPEPQQWQQPVPAATPDYSPAATPAQPWTIPAAVDDAFDAAASSVYTANEHGMDKVMRDRSGLCPLVISFSAKGGTGKSSCAACLAQRAGERGLRVVLIDMNRGQGDQRIYLRLNGPGVTLPSIYDAAINPQIEANPKLAIIPPGEIAKARQQTGGAKTSTQKLSFGMVLAPTGEEANPSIVTSTVYRRVIETARRNADLVILDTQIVESYDNSGLIDGVVVPALLNGAWGVAVSDMSRASVSNLNERLQMFASNGVSTAHMLLLLNKVDESSVVSEQHVDKMFGSLATYGGRINLNAQFGALLNVGTLDHDNPAAAPALDNVLHRITQLEQFNPERHAVSPKKQRGLFGKKK